MDESINLKELLEQHKQWLQDNTKGNRLVLIDRDLRGSDLRGSNLRGSDLRGSDLSYSNLRGSDLRGSDLRGSNLDFSTWPLRCGSFHAKADDRLVLQLFAHITRLNIEGCSKHVQKIVKKLPELAKNGFCKYRDDVERI